MRRLLLAGAVVIGTLGLVGTAAADTQRFEFTGGEQSFFVPDGVTEVNVEAVGGRGGAGKTGLFDTVDVPGGAGAVARATLSVTPGQRLFVSVGGNGGDGHAAAGAGGFNGGGGGGTGSGDPVFTFGGGGGGASDVRTNSRTDPIGGLRLIIAGGGGGAGNGHVDGVGGGAGGAGGSAGGDGDPFGPCTAAKGGEPGGSASPGQGGAGASVPGGGGGSGSPGGNGNLGVGGQGGSEFPPGGGGGGGGGGLFGGGGGGGGAAIYPGNPTCTPGGGGGGSSGFAPGATNTSVGIDQTGVPSVTFTFSRGGGNAGPLSPTALALTNLALTNKAFRVGPRPKGASRQVRSGTEFLFTLSGAARVDFAIERREQSSCGPRGKRKCIRFRSVTSFSQVGAAGSNQVPFSGRYGKRKLSPGRYQATVTAADSAGNRTAPQQISFRVVAP